MQVISLDLIHFTSHDRTRFVFPKTGILAITGDNGSGKSSIAEGVSWGGWGKMLRGDLPWRDDAKEYPCSVTLNTHDFLIERSRTGSKGKLEWTSHDGDAMDAPGARSGDPEYDTPTKAQEALASMLGPHDLWKKTHVFTSSDADHFSIATDAERKRLIEAFLGLDRFDPALQRCRDALKVAVRTLSDLAQRELLATTKLDGARTRLREAKQALAAAKPPLPAETLPAPPPNAAAALPLAPLDAKLATARAELTEVRQKLREADRAGAGQEAEAAGLRRLLERLRADRCPTCTQPIDPKLRHRLQVEAELADHAAKHAKIGISTEREEAATLVEELEEEIALLNKKRNERAATNAQLAATTRAEEQARTLAERTARLEAERYASQHTMLEHTLREADDAIATLTTELETLAAGIASSTTNVAELTACEQVLGLKGVRAHILGKSLNGIEAVANTWMGRLHESGKIALKPYAEKGTPDSISLTIDGIGRGSYKSTSGGERRRVDVALLLGLAEVSAAARGVTTGTLFFDEVLDCLDEGGVESVAAALAEIARDRCVVIITHSKTLLERLPTARKIRVANGVVEEI